MAQFSLVAVSECKRITISILSWRMEKGKLYQALNHIKLLSYDWRI